MKITEMIMTGEVLRPANLDEEAVKLLIEKEGEYVMVKDKDGNVRLGPSGCYLHSRRMS